MTFFVMINDSIQGEITDGGDPEPWGAMRVLHLAVPRRTAATGRTLADWHGPPYDS